MVLSNKGSDLGFRPGFRPGRALINPANTAYEFSAVNLRLIEFMNYEFMNYEFMNYETVIL